MDDWDEKTERRVEERMAMAQQLGALEVRVAHIEKSLDKLDHVSEQLDNFVKQGQGIGKLLQVLFYIVGPIVAAIYWIKDHVR